MEGALRQGAEDEDRSERVPERRFYGGVEGDGGVDGEEEEGGLKGWGRLLASDGSKGFGARICGKWDLKVCFTMAWSGMRV